jgi:hypothetical protein
MQYQPVTVRYSTKRLPGYYPVYAPSPWLKLLIEIERGALALHYSGMLRLSRYSAGTSRPIDPSFVPPKEWFIKPIDMPVLTISDALEAEQYIMHALGLRQTPT